MLVHTYPTTQLSAINTSMLCGQLTRHWIFNLWTIDCYQERIKGGGGRACNCTSWLWSGRNGRLVRKFSQSNCKVFKWVANRVLITHTRAVGSWHRRLHSKFRHKLSIPPSYMLFRSRLLPIWLHHFLGVYVEDPQHSYGVTSYYYSTANKHSCGWIEGGYVSFLH